MAKNVEIRRSDGVNFNEKINVATHWSLIEGKPTTFTPTSHSHSEYIRNHGSDLTPLITGDSIELDIAGIFGLKLLDRLILTGAETGNTLRVENVATPVNTYDAANKGYVDDKVASVGGGSGGSFEWSIISSMFAESGVLSGVPIPADYKIITVMYVKYPNYPSNDGAYVPDTAFPWVYPLFKTVSGVAFKISNLTHVGNPSSFVNISYDDTAQNFVVSTEWDPSLDPGFVYILGGK